MQVELRRFECPLGRTQGGVVRPGLAELLARSIQIGFGGRHPLRRLGQGRLGLIDIGLLGLLSAPRDPGQLAENIVWLLNHPEQARKMSQSARERVVPAFSAERMVEQIDALYETLLDSIPASNGRSGSCSATQHVLKRLSL